MMRRPTLITSNWEEPLTLRTKDNVDHAGLSVPLPLTNLPVQLKPKPKLSLSLNNTWSTAPKKEETKDATED